MGLMNAPATFMHTMSNLFSNMLDFGMAVFLDDILVYSCMVKEHFMLLEKVLVYLCQYIFYCKVRECSFIYNSTILLDFDVSP